MRTPSTRPTPGPWSPPSPPGWACPSGCRRPEGGCCRYRPGSYHLSSPYGPRWGGFHDGQDFAAPTGTPICAAAAGTVVAAGCTSPVLRPARHRRRRRHRPITPGCGWTVDPASRRVATKYCHASALAVHEGQTVTAGQVIGWVGSTGNSTGPHLHFQVHLHAPPMDTSTAVDPVAYLASVGVKVG